MAASTSGLHNLDWGQALKGLKRWMQRNNVQHINLSYFGTADPHYHEIDCTYIPGVPFWIRKPEPRVLPGYGAVNTQFRTRISFNEFGKHFYKGLREQQPIATIGYPIRIYKVDRAWWGTGNKS